MRTLLEALNDANSRLQALSHFNISEIAALNAIVDVVRETRLPVIIGLSEGERKFFGASQAAAVVRSIREESGLEIYLDADHTHSLQSAEAAARAGYDLIVFDASERPFEENVSLTRKAVEAAKSINPKILVEGEIGFIGSGSQLHEAPQAAAVLTSPEEARQFAEATHADLLSPAVGTMHGMLPGMLRGEVHKHLNIPRVAEISKATQLYLTLHGGSGTADDDFVRAIDAGIRIIHVNTELRVAWRRGVESALAADPKEVAPYTLLSGARAQIADVARSRLLLFSRTALTH
jgi:fructose-bisphosphate aldolase, class II